MKDGVTEAGLDWIVLEWSSRAALQEEWYATYIHILWELRSVDRNAYGKFQNWKWKIQEQVTVFDFALQNVMSDADATI